MTCKHNIVEWI